MPIPVSFSGTGATSGGTAAGNSGFDPSALISVGVGLLGNFIVTSNDAAARRKMEERLGQLSIEQQRILQEKLMLSTAETDRMRIVYEALAADKNRDAAAQLNKEKYRGLAILGVGITVLAIVIVIARRHG